MEKYIIMTRYQYINTNCDICMTDWFVLDGNSYSKQGAEQRIEEIKKAFEFIDKKTKLSHEYKMILRSDHEKERDELRKELDKAAKKQEEYYKSDEYKELKKKKRIAAKERKERQKKYIEEMLAKEKNNIIK